ncbi:hypothetical protein [Aliirhizobium cellulosilyticum]|uniref:BMFP domain-containing protein YqiC n=1 Tax=Aliirhizobium cellulosilyticum TaxID=393664 RepID=A0A7W6TFB6_9HYPH|nr:hypothetical protein [Rhizobium cellulosilyticum]MBB4349338.1 BMFP domain-containing protein YqiC [Rhizobium cellulosilyticum]MBB4412440.1 BMFP domain-containing protein YqiC [Rhizobium cellulosilyticum]MBB4447072.1 BMFP domain-containing protein YqiC [Rhizobium cellulosilyticum]
MLENPTYPTNNALTAATSDSDFHYALQNSRPIERSSTHVHLPSQTRDTSTQIAPFFPQIMGEMEADISDIVELTLAEALADPLIALLNQADGVSRQNFASTMELAQQTHDDHHNLKIKARAAERKKLLHAFLDLPMEAWPSRHH